MFIKSSFMVIKKWNQPESVNRLVGKENVKYMYNGTLFCLGKKILSLFSVIYMDPYEHWVEWNEPGTKRWMTYDLTHMWNLK